MAVAQAAERSYILGFGTATICHLDSILDVVLYVGEALLHRLPLLLIGDIRVSAVHCVANGCVCRACSKPLPPSVTNRLTHRGGTAMLVVVKQVMLAVCMHYHLISHELKNICNDIVCGSSVTQMGMWSDKSSRACKGLRIIVSLCRRGCFECNLACDRHVKMVM